MRTTALPDRDSASHRDLVRSFAGSTPVRHLVIDDFLSLDWAEELLADFPRLDAMPKSRDYVFSSKQELSTLDRHSDASRALHEVLTGGSMAALLSDLVGRPVEVDPEYFGGGFHAGAEGSYLHLHTDFNLHPVREDWQREANLLLYLNPGWEPTWGGELRLTSSPSSPGIRVAPVFNRLVIMESTASSFHGYDPITFPAGHIRRSIAAYGYSRTTEAVARRVTQWRPPSDAPLRARVLARNWDRIVLTKNRILGSGTLKNRR